MGHHVLGDAVGRYPFSCSWRGRARRCQKPGLVHIEREPKDRRDVLASREFP